MEQSPQVRQDPMGGIDSEDEIDLSELLGTLLDAKWLIASVSALFLAGGIFYALVSTPIYQADAVLQVEEKSGGLAGLGDLTEMFPAETEASTEIEIIKSRNIIGKAVDRLDLTLHASPNYFPKIGAAMARYHDSAALAEPVDRLEEYAWGGERIQVGRLSVPARLEGEPLLLVAESDDSYRLFTEDGVLLLSGKVGEAAEGSGVEIFVSELVSRPGTEFIVSRGSRIGAIRGLQSGLKISERGRKTGILEIRLDGADRKQITKVVDTIANLYLRQNVERMSEEAERSLSFLEEQLPIIKKEMELAEAKLNNYRSSRSSVDLTLETQSMLDQMVELERRLAEIDLRRSEMSKKYTDRHPLMVALGDQAGGLNERLGEISGRAQTLPDTQQEILRLSRDVEVATTIYTQLLNRAQELKVVKAGTVGNVRIIDRAVVSDKPVKPKKRMIALLSLVLGLFLGIGIAFVRRAMHKGVEDPDLIEKQMGIPVYATVPLSPKQLLLEKDLKAKKIKNAILSEKDKKDQAIEGLRSLRTNLHFALLEAKNKIVMITGPAPGVGKSFVSTNFAHIVAHAGMRVLLVDADMRKGHINKEYGMTRAPGLSEFIVGDATREQAVRPTGFEGVDLLATGTVPPNPSELLMHENFGRYMEQFSGEYDLVLVDTPPLLAVTDSAVVGRLAGTTFILLRAGVHPMREIQAVTKRLQQNGIEPRGFILNALEPKRRYGYGKYSKYGYGKYAHYGYEYK